MQAPYMLLFHKLKTRKSECPGSSRRLSTTKVGYHFQELELAIPFSIELSSCPLVVLIVLVISLAHGAEYGTQDGCRSTASGNSPSNSTTKAYVSDGA